MGLIVKGGRVGSGVIVWGERNVRNGSKGKRWGARAGGGLKGEWG
jgi:hypothetical protein